MKKNKIPKLSEQFVDRLRIITKASLLLGSAVLTAGLLLVTFLNLTYSKSLFDETKEKILSNPADPQPKIFLAQQLFSTNQFPLSLAILNSIGRAGADQATVTQVQTEVEKIRRISQESKLVEEKMNFWRNAIQQFPSYRDAYIELVILSWKLYRLDEAKISLQSALLIDPNNELIQKLISQIR